MARRSRNKKPIRGSPAAAPTLPRRDWLWAALIFVAVVLAYSPVWWAGYIWDDDFMITANPCIIGPLGLKEIWTTIEADICPLTLTTIWIGHALWGLAPLPYHLLNVALHGAAALVLWRVLLRLRVPGAWLGAALWALHPVNVESVAWISEMKNAESGLFFLLSVLCYVKSLRAGEGNARAAWTLNDALTLLFAALAMASKSSTVILPFVLGLCAWWIEGRWYWVRLIKIAPIFLCSIAAGLLTLWTQQWHAKFGLPVARSWPERLITAGDAFWFYLGKLAWPHPLLTIYPLWHLDPAQPLSYLPLIAAIGVAGVLWWKRGSWARPWFFAFAFFIVALLPVLGFVTNSFARYSCVADHFQYLASIGPLALAGALLVKVAEIALPEKTAQRGTLIACFLVLPGALTWCQAWNYQTQEKLWMETLKYNPDCWEACTNLGNILLDRGQPDKAIPLYQRALQGNPGSAVTWFNLGLASIDQGRTDEGVADYERALRILPDYAVAHNALACVLLDKGQPDDAIAHLKQATDAIPNFASAHYNLGRALVGKGQVADAIAEFRRAVAIRPEYAAAQFALGGYLVKTGQTQEGIAHLQAAAELEPNDDHVLVGVALALADHGRPDEAVARLQKAHEINPRNEDAVYNLGRVLLQLGRVDDAIGFLREAMDLNSSDARAHNNLGVALVQKGQIGDAIAQFQEALRLMPNYPDAQKNLAVVQAQAAKRSNH